MFFLFVVIVSWVTGMSVVLWLSSKHAPIALNQDYLTVIGGTLSFHGVVLVLLPRLLRAHGATLGSAFGFSNPRRVRAVILGVLVGAATLPLIVFLGELSAKVLQWLGITTELQAPVQILQRSVSPSLHVVIFIAAVLVAPVAEEIIFRGILYPTIKQVGFPHVALWVTSILFATVHGNMMTFLPFTALALILTFLYEKTDNLLSAIVMHSFFNLINFFRVAASTAG